jgi:hypothetical protein
MSNHNQNTQSILAKTLAEENLKVQFDPSAKTAMCDVANRVIILPVWEGLSDSVRDLLIGHEIAHALYTPDIDKGKKSDEISGPWTSAAEDIGGNVHASYVQGIMQIVEDVRIERKVKSKYPGLRRDFSAGYRELFDKNFFGTDGIDINKSSFPDRINLHFKVGVHLAVPFSAEEQVIVNAIEKNDTFDGTINLTSEVFRFIGGSKTHIEMPKTQNSKSTSSSSSTENSESGESDSSKSEPMEQSTMPMGSAMDTEESNSLPIIRTQSNFDRNQQNSVSDRIYQVKYATLPIANQNRMILPFKKTNAILSDFFSNFQENSKSHGLLMTAINEKYSRLLSNSKPLINQLVQQFEMKKSADEQKRTTTSRSGKLDTDRLCLHKITDDIFLNYSKVADGQNHGMVMFIDWSSSMNVSTEDVLTQVVMLSQFCKRMHIPFDVYLFSSSQHLIGKHLGGYSEPQYVDLNQWNTKSSVDSFRKATSHSTKTTKDNDKFNNESLSLIHILSSDMNTKEFTDALKNVFTLGQFVTRPADIRVVKGEPSQQVANVNLYPPVGFSQGNTPLDSTIIAAMNIVPEFQKKHKVQIVNTIFLTDGETGHSPIQGMVGNRDSKGFVTCPINGKEYSVDNFQRTTDALLHIFGDVTGSNTIGFYIVVAKAGYCPYFAGSDRKEEIKKMNEVGFYEAPAILNLNYYGRTDTIRNHGYDRLFVLPNNHDITDIDSVDEAMNELPTNATFTRVRNTFFKTIEKRSSSRVFINRFSDVIANQIKR